MSTTAKRKAKLRRHRQLAQSAPVAGAGGVPEFAPTPERMARGDVRRTLLVDRVQDRSPDQSGDRPAAQLREVVVGVVRRDMDAFAAGRLKRLRFLSAEQIAAAARLERDMELARYDPLMVSDPSRGRCAPGGGPAPDRWLPDVAIDARERVHEARRALRRGGEELVRVVEAVVVDGAGTAEAGHARYRARRDAVLHVRSHLSIGLNLLAHHYAGASRASARAPT